MTRNISSFPFSWAAKRHYFIPTVRVFENLPHGLLEYLSYTLAVKANYMAKSISEDQKQRF